ncbi:MAG: hypothetical protein P4L34_04085 [Paludibacter sp.]|nr:hypothetical protein [Paludibacter sp.]
MNRTLNHKGHVLLALLFTAVFFVSMLVKPMHILFVHHDLSEITILHSNKPIVSNSYENDCPICDFDFCFFVSNTQINIPKAGEIYAIELTPQVVDCIVNHTSHHFQLRAPPVF